MSTERWSLAAWLVLLLALAGAAAAELTLSDPESEVYYRYAVVAGDRVQLEMDVVVTGDLHSNGDVDLKRDSSVEGDVTAVGSVEQRGTVSGAVSEGAPHVTLPEILDEASLRALADRVFEGDQTFTDETIDDVVFVAGTARIRGDVRGAGAVIATGDVRLDTTGGGGFSPLEPATRLSLIALNDIRLGQDRPFRGALRAGRDIDLEMGVVFEGVAVAGRTIHVKQGARITFVDFDQTAPEITLVSPAAGAFLPTATPEVEVAYSDDLSGLRPDSVLLVLDGVDVTAEADIGPEGLTFTPAPLADGLHTLEVAVTDRSDNEARETFTFTTDTEPPTVAVTSPAEEVLFNTVPPVEVAYADATSGVDLDSVAIDVDGTALTDCTVEASSASCPAPELEAGAHTVAVEVRDAAGNAATASFTFELVFDLEPPALVITAPAAPVIFNDATPETAVEYSDAVAGVDLASLSVAVDGVALTGCAVTASAATCEPPELAAGDHTVSAAVSDLAGNAATASFTFELVFDLEPPTITLSAPDDVTLQQGGTATATVEDDTAVAEVVFRLDGVELARFTAPPFEVDVEAPAGAEVGDVLVLTVEASDTAGNVASLTHEVRVAGGGVVVGQVLSDEAGHPLAGARAWILGQEERVAVTDDEGRYSLPAFDSQVVVRIESADGSTLPVERPLTVLPEVGTVAVDSRLRTLAPPVTVGAGGGTVEAEGAALVFPAGALDGDTPVRLTPLGPQGLPSLLPLGWSPLAAFDVTGPASFQTAVEATVDALPPEVLHLARYRRSDHRWVMVRPGVVVSGGAAVVALAQPGSYALLALDGDAPADFLPPAGGALPGVEAVSLPLGAVCEGEVIPPVLPPSGGTARGILSLLASGPLPSGTVVRTEVTETFTLASGTEGSSEVRSQDVVFYRLPAPAGAALGAEIPVVPVRTFETGELVEARVHVEVLSGRVTQRGRVGGEAAVSVESGSAALAVAAGSLAEDTAISLEVVELSPFVPAASDLIPLAEVVVDFSGRRLALPAELSVEGFAGDSFLVARVERIDGVSLLVAVAAAELAAGRVVSVPHPDLPGITEGGRYVVYRSSTSFGLVSGVTRSDAGPVRAVVESDVWPLAAVAGTDGRYTLAVRPGPATLSARVPATNLTGSASVEAVAGQTVAADLHLAGSVTTATVTPADGATGVPRSAQVEIVASVALARASVTAENVRLFQGPVADGVAVAVRLVLSASGRSLSVIPEERLEPATDYTLVNAGLADVHGGLVVVPTVSFTTAAEEPLEVDTDELVLTFPDDDGLVRLVAPPGTLPPGTTILIVNDGNGVAVSFTVGNDGSVDGEIPATIDDVLQITLVDPDGNVLTFERSRFVAQDGRTAVGPGGGVVVGPGGAELRIPEGALDQGAVFQVEPFGPDVFPERPDLPGGVFGGGLRVTAPPDLEMKKPGDLVFPKPPEAPDGAFYYVYRRLTGPEGQVGFEVIDHAFVEGEGEDARVATASYPFIGWKDSTSSWEAAADGQILGFGLAAQTDFYLMYTFDSLLPGLSTQGLITGNATRAVLEPGAIEPVFEPLPGVAVQSDRGTLTIARSGADGTYSLWDSAYLGGPVEVTASAGADALTLTAFEADPDTTRDLKLPVQYRNIAIANFAFPPEEPPVQVAAFETRVMKLDAEGQREDAGGIVVAGTPLVIGFRYTSSGSRPVIQSATILGETFAVRPDTADDPLRVDFVLDRDFTPPAAGTYKVTAVALPPLGGSPITVEHTFLAVAPGGSNRNPLPGTPPDVITELLDPPDGGSGVPVGVLPTVVFTEPVKNLPGNVRLLDGDGREVAVGLSGVGVDAAGNPVVIEDLAAAGAGAAVTSLTVRPVATLRYGTAYRLVLQQGIVDLDETPTGQPDPQPLAGAPRSFTFETFKAEVLGRTDFFPGWDVVAFRDRAYVATEDAAGHGWVVAYDASDPTALVEVGRAVLTGRAMSVDGQEISPATGSRLIVAAAAPNLVTKGPSNLFLFDASDDNLERVGVVSLTQSMEEGTVLRVAVKGRHAYVITFRTTTGAAVDIVDLVRARELHDAALQAGENIATDMVSPGVGFGQQAIVGTLPVRATGSSSLGHLFGIAAGDFLFRDASQTLVVAVGTVPPVAVIDPLAVETVFADPVFESAEGSVSIGSAVALGILDGRQMAVVVGRGRGRDAGGVLTDGPVLAVLDLTDPERPELISSILLDSLPKDVVLSDGLALVGTDKKVLLVGLDDPANPALAGEIADLGGRLALGDGGVLFGASQDPTTGGLRTAALGSLALIHRISPSLIDLDQNDRSYQPIEIEYELINPPPQLSQAHISLSEDDQEVMRINLTDLGPGRHTVEASPGIQFDPAPETVEIVLVRPDGSETAPFFVSRLSLEQAVDNRAEQSEIATSQSAVPRRELSESPAQETAAPTTLKAGVAASLSPNLVPRGSPDTLVELTHFSAPGDQVFVRRLDGEWAPHPVSRESVPETTLLTVPQSLLIVPSLLLVADEPDPWESLSLLVFDPDLPQPGTAPEIQPLLVQIYPGAQSSSSTLAVTGIGFEEGMRIVLGRGDTPGFALDTTLEVATTLVSTIPTPSLGRDEDLFVAILNADGSGLSGRLFIPVQLRSGGGSGEEIPDGDAPEGHDLSEFRAADYFDLGDTELTDVTVAFRGRLELRGVGLSEGLEVILRTRNREGKVDQVSSAPLESPAFVEQARAQDPALKTEGPRLQQAFVALLPPPRPENTARLIGTSSSGNVVVASPSVRYAAPRPEIPFGQERWFGVYTCDQGQSLFISLSAGPPGGEAIGSNCTSSERPQPVDRRIVIAENPTTIPPHGPERQIHRVQIASRARIATREAGSTAEVVAVRGAALTDEPPCSELPSCGPARLQIENREPPVSATVHVVYESLNGGRVRCGQEDQDIDCDKEIFGDISNKYGIPPQFLKSQLFTESLGFRYNFRYEPSTVDVQRLSGDAGPDGVNDRQGRRRIFQEPYTRYILRGRILNTREQRRVREFAFEDSRPQEGRVFQLAGPVKRLHGYHGNLVCIVASEREVRYGTYPDSVIAIQQPGNRMLRQVRGSDIWQQCKGGTFATPFNGYQNNMRDGEFYVDFRAGEVVLATPLMPGESLSVTYLARDAASVIPVEQDGVLVSEAPHRQGDMLPPGVREDIVRYIGAFRYVVGESLATWLERSLGNDSDGSFLATRSDSRLEFAVGAATGGGAREVHVLDPKLDSLTSQLWAASSYGAFQQTMDGWEGTSGCDVLSGNGCTELTRAFWDILPHTTERNMFTLLQPEGVEISAELAAVRHSARGIIEGECSPDDCSDRDWEKFWSIVFRSYNSGGERYCLNCEVCRPECPEDGTCGRLEDASRTRVRIPADGPSILIQAGKCYGSADVPECCNNGNCPWFGVRRGATCPE